MILDRQFIVVLIIHHMIHSDETYQSTFGRPEMLENEPNKASEYFYHNFEAYSFHKYKPISREFEGPKSWSTIQIKFLDFIAGYSRLNPWQKSHWRKLTNDFLTVRRNGARFKQSLWIFKPQFLELLFSEIYSYVTCQSTFDGPKSWSPIQIHLLHISTAVLSLHPFRK